jgi:signal peptidase I
MSENNDPIIKVLDTIIAEIKDLFKMFFTWGLLLIFFLFVFFNITQTPTKSMYPTVKKGDTILTLKILYGINLHNLDIPSIHHTSFWKNILTYIPQKKIFNFRGVKQGDIIGFRSNGDLNTGFLKRAIGLGGDTIQMKQGVLYINNKPIIRKFIRSKIVKKTDKELNYVQKKTKFLYYQETLPNGVTYMVRYIEGRENSYVNNTKPVTIPRGFVFAMGDNRDNSDDSRGNVGFIPVNNISQKASIIIFAKGGQLELLTLDIKKMLKSLKQLPTKIKWKRFGTLL